MALNETQESFGFSVDTHLFRELGELLVGRDSTALIELVKNAYDADATVVTVRGEDLRGPNGRIVVSDNGVGMTPDVFRGAFLRIAGRYKEKGSKQSPLYGRHYTGAKGVGRLSAHKLARKLVVNSVPRNLAGNDLRGVQATIDWQKLEEEYETFDDARQGLDVRTFPVTPQHSYGTRLQLERLRRRWTGAALSSFVSQISSCTPPIELTQGPPPSLFSSSDLFDDFVVSSRTPEDPGFRIKFEGDLNAGEDLWPQLLEQTGWLVEIRAKPEGVEFNIQPSLGQVSSKHGGRDYQLRREHPDPHAGPFFSARIYARVGQVRGIGARSSSLRKFARTSRGVRVYVEGFRVLPYGDQGDDWLNLDRDYARREREFSIELDDASSRLLMPVEREAYFNQGNDQYVGAVFMTAAGASPLRPVVNREGFVQDAAFEVLRELVRNGVDLLTRVRASHARAEQSARLNTIRRELSPPQAPPAAPSTGHQIQQSSSSTIAEPADSSSDETSDGLSLPISITRREIRTLKVELGANSDVAPRLALIEKAIDYIEEAQRGDEVRATLQILAGVGLQLAAFVHDINGILGLAQAIRTIALAVAGEDDQRRRGELLADLEKATDELVQSLSRQSSYLVEVVGPDARRRRRRIPYPAAIEPSLRLLATTLMERRIEVVQQVDQSARTPPVFPAEITIILTNVLTNAVKAAGEKGRILISATPGEDGGLVLRVENTGVQVDLDQSERWFRPFESTTTEVDTVLGQGMGMGLPIVRRLVAEYNGSARFVAPTSEYKTAIEVRIPGRRTGQ
ncbi:ATP-binding protein [Micromonospora halophytica]|uniref:Signal transduction histidine kinase n=1 Tax=Micromonospora halophytica TaxID=47864 RepID=A0A1C5JCU6_9ACTN|nr:ATP-binding protein [Micromonospora halophytica]SCG68390.1 Signal transduction histidine kinase [Micromonospora halophytica]